MQAWIVELIGTLAGTLTTAAFLPQAIKSWRTHSVGDLSLPTFTMQTTGVFLWLIYGILHGSFPIIIANAITFLINGAVLAAILRAKASPGPAGQLPAGGDSSSGASSGTGPAASS